MLVDLLAFGVGTLFMCVWLLVLKVRDLEADTLARFRGLETRLRQGQGGS